MANVSRKPRHARALIATMTKWPTLASAPHNDRSRPAVCRRFTRRSATRSPHASAEPAPTQWDSPGIATAIAVRAENFAGKQESLDSGAQALEADSCPFRSLSGPEPRMGAFAPVNSPASRKPQVYAIAQAGRILVRRCRRVAAQSSATVMAFPTKATLSLYFLPVRPILAYRGCLSGKALFDVATMSCALPGTRSASRRANWRPRP